MSADLGRVTPLTVQVTERRSWEGPLVERLLRGILHQDARHAAVSLTREAGELRYHTDGVWEPARALPPKMLGDLRAQLQALFERAEPSCDRGASVTIELAIPDHGPAAFRMHRVGASSWILTALPRTEASLSIVDREHAEARRDHFEQGRQLLERGAYAQALGPLTHALSMVELLGSTAERARIELTIGFAHELAGEFLRAEAVYKRCLRRIESDYGRDDVQRVAIFGRLAHCAATRGDRAVADMWRDRGCKARIR